MVATVQAACRTVDTKETSRWERCKRTAGLLAAQHLGTKDKNSVESQLSKMKAEALDLLQFLKGSEPWMERTLDKRIFQFNLNYSDVQKWKALWGFLGEPYASDSHGSDGSDDGDDDSTTLGLLTPPEPEKDVVDHAMSPKEDEVDEKPINSPTSHEQLSSTGDGVVPLPCENLQSIPKGHDNVPIHYQQSISTEGGGAPHSKLDDQDKALVLDQLQVLHAEAVLRELFDDCANRRVETYPRERATSIDNGVLERWYWEGEPGTSWPWLNDIESATVERWEREGEPWCWPSLKAEGKRVFTCQ